MFVSGIISFCPIVRRFDCKSLAFLSSSTDILYFFAIFHKESPDCTIYVISSVGSSISGIINCCPTDRIFDVKLFAVFKLSTVVLNCLAIEYSESPFLTIYASDISSSFGINSCWFICIIFEDKSFKSIMACGVVLYSFAIE